MTTLDNWFDITVTNTRAPPLVKALVEKPKAKTLEEPPALVKPNPFYAIIRSNESCLSDALFDWAMDLSNNPSYYFYTVTFSFTTKQIRAYNNAQLSSLFCKKMFNFCAITKSHVQYVREYTKQDVPHFHAIVAFPKNNTTIIRNKLFNMLGDTLISNLNPQQHNFVEEQWKKKNGKEYKVKTRTTSLRHVTDYMSKITSKKKCDWFISYDKHYHLL